ncbi:hypothetical protein BV25DRAFT_1801256 [Artomyces pyxidatus]|uniref:Uncharacterized protein n=1 Tax=Artomyces pyxidatus TaxID=48021 RepID=A0ACB8T8E9_9AGAM|nr:hypothetical protein BV25DRAFT_1801256 [Artomyces pyxidatus]
MLKCLRFYRVTDSAISSGVTIVFPSGLSSTTTDSASDLSAITTTPTSTFTPIANTQLSYVTATSLLFSAIPTTSLTASLSDPDAPATTVSIPTVTSGAQVTQAPLPSNLPARIYPPGDAPDPTTDMTLISVLFDQGLPWSFVAGNTESQGQLMILLPQLVMSALNLTQDQVLTFALQVYIPNTYTGPDDVSQLLTTYLLYIPTADVSVLANQIKAKTSPFYTALGPPYSDLAAHVDPAYAVTSVQSPNQVPGSGNNAGSSGDTSASGGSSNNTRTDAIIGVVSALGGITLIVLAVLIVRSVKRRRELAHHRLSDPNVGYPDRAGRDFDQDSVGGQRRRSFYFAEDSLRGAGPAPASSAQPTDNVVEYSYRNAPDQMRERRPVVPAAISAPYLQQSSLNW